VTFQLYITGSLSKWVDEKNRTINEISTILKKFKTASVSRWNESLRSLSAKNQVEDLTIALVGPVGSGKSSLLNALLGIPKCSPTGCEGFSVTQTAIEISSSSDNTYEATIIFNNKQEWKEINEQWNQCEEEMIDVVGEEMMDVFEGDLMETNYEVVKEYENESNHEYHSKLNEFVDTVINSSKDIEREVNKVNFTQASQVVEESLTKTPSIVIRCCSAENLRKTVSPFVTVKSESDENNVCKLVKCIKMRIPNIEMLTKVVFLDLPGRGDSKRPASKTVDKYLNNCHAIWIVTPIIRCLGDNAKNIIDEKFCKKLILDGRVGAVSFICTKTDEIDDETCMENSNFTELIEQIKTCKDKISRNKENQENCLNRDEKKDFQLKGYQLADELKLSEKTLKEKCVLLTSDEVKTNVKKHLITKTNVKDDLFKVYCISSKEYLKCHAGDCDATSVFLTIDNTGIPELSQQVRTISKENVYFFKNQLLLKTCFLINNIVNTVQGKNSQVRPKKAKNLFEEQLRLLSNVFNTICREFFQDFEERQADLERQLDLGKIDGIAKADATCKSWGQRYKLNTYKATVCQSGKFISGKNGPVDFNEELCEELFNLITTEWLEFFTPDACLLNFKLKVLAACEKSYKTTCTMLCLKSVAMPRYIIPQVTSAIRRIQQSVKHAQKSTHRMISMTVQQDMRPAYKDCTKLKSGGKGVYKKMRDIVESHVYMCKKDMLNNLDSKIKEKLNEVVKKIERDVDSCCDRLIKDLRGMYESNFEEPTIQGGVNQRKVLQDFRDVIKHLQQLDDHDCILDETNKLDSRLHEMLSGAASSGQNEPPNPKRIKTHE